MFLSRRDSAYAAAACALVASWAGPAAADTLADALLQAYRTNPNLASERAQLRGLDESVVQARTGLRPTLGLNTSLTYDGVYPSQATPELTDIGAWGMNLTQPVYTGGRTTAAIRAAEATVLAGRQTLAAGEQSIMQSVIQAYMDVRRDQQVIDIRTAELKILQGQLDDARLRLKAGDITETDVLQSRAQVELARANLVLAQGQLQVSRSSYRNVVGEDPGQLDPEPPLPGLPATVDQAFDAAEADNPTLRQAWFKEQASRQKVAEAKAANRPTVAVQASAGFTDTGGYNSSDGNTYHQFYRVPPKTSFTAQVALTQPLFTGGLNASSIRQSLETNASDQLGIEATRRSVVQAVSQAWNSLVANRASLALDQQQIATALAYLADTQIEYRAGQRSTLDVLIAEQTLAAAKLAQASARHDTYMGQVALLSAMGRLQLQNLLSGTALYDPAVSYKRVNRIGATPWDPLMRAIDGIGAPKAGVVPPPVAPPTPPKPDPAMFRPSNGPIPDDAPLATAGRR